MEAPAVEALPIASSNVSAPAPSAAAPAPAAAAAVPAAAAAVPAAAAAASKSLAAQRVLCASTASWAAWTNLTVAVGTVTSTVSDG